MRVNHVILTSAVAFSAAFGATAASAQTFDVKQVEVKKGELEYSPEHAFQRGIPSALRGDINRFATEQTLAYGLLDW